MRPDQRPRTAIRRDAHGPRTIRSADVRYPGFEPPDTLIDVAEYDARRTTRRAPAGSERSRDERPLRPARDTGLALSGRMAREQRRRAIARRRRAVSFAVTIALLAVAALGWRYASDRKAARSPFASATPVAAHDQGADAFRAERDKVEPTPVFASYGSLTLRLPVPTAKLTEVGFHQAAYTYALHMTTTLPNADMTAAKRNKGTGRDNSTLENGANAVLGGSVLRMWRNRPGKPDSAVDVGAAPGSDVYAPVSGTIVKVKAYKLYGKYDDYELHIRPDGFPGIDLVMIHVTDLTIKEGDPVIAGITRLAAVRKLSNVIHDQLADYSQGGGDHVHFQLNNANDSAYKGLDGAITVSDDGS